MPFALPRCSQWISVTTGQTASLNIALWIAGEHSTVNVTESATSLQVESSTLGGLVSREAVQALPLSSRNYTQILALSPGIVVDLSSAAVLGNGTQNVSARGASPLSNNVQSNGVDANNLVHNSAAQAESSQTRTAIPASDSIQWVRIDTANYDAAYGRCSGANIDLVTRSGTNSFHGSMWEFTRNNIFNANEFFIKQDGQPRVIGLPLSSRNNSAVSGRNRIRCQLPITVVSDLRSSSSR